LECSPFLLVYAQSVSGLVTAASLFCASLTSLLPLVAMLMVVLASVIYASGQVMGAETRARANVWATAALTGAMMAILIAAIAQPTMRAIYGEDIKCQPNNLQTVYSLAGVISENCPPEGCICGCSGVVPAPPTIICPMGQHCGCTLPPAYPFCDEV